MKDISVFTLYAKYLIIIRLSLLYFILNKPEGQKQKKSSPRASMHCPPFEHLFSVVLHTDMSISQLDPKMKNTVTDFSFMLDCIINAFQRSETSLIYAISYILFGFLKNNVIKINKNYLSLTLKSSIRPIEAYL